VETHQHWKKALVKDKRKALVKQKSGCVFDDMVHRPTFWGRVTEIGNPVQGVVGVVATAKMKE
jgi:hypothetical protein